MTPAQLQTLATDIENNTDQTVIDALAAGNNNAIVTWYNQQSSPDYYVWKSTLSTAEMRADHFDWAEIVSSLTTNSMLALQLLIDQEQIDPSRSSIRDAFQEIFAGPNLANTRTALVAAAKRLATNVQKLFADTSGGDGSEGTPATAVVESASLQNVRDAVALIGG